MVRGGGASRRPVPLPGACAGSCCPRSKVRPLTLRDAALTVVSPRGDSRPGGATRSPRRGTHTAMTYRAGVKQANADLDPLAALRSRLEVLVGVQDAIGQLLGDLGIRTVLDLALSPVFALAAASGNGEAQAYPLAAVPGDLVIDGGPSDLGELAAADLSALRAFPEPSASAVRQAMQVDVVADLGRWAPYRAALQVL